MSQLIAGTDTALLADGFEMTQTGVTVIGEPTLEQFGDAVDACGRMANATQWALGDLLIYAEGRGDWGEMYTQFVHITDRSYHQVAKAARVSKHFPPGELRQYASDLSFTHHYEALRAPRAERMELLADAVDREWSAAELRDRVDSVLVPVTERNSGHAFEALAPVTGPPTDSDEWSGKVTIVVECIDPFSADNLEAYCNAVIGPQRFKLTRQ
jgi:hypothetical protein